MNYPYPLKLNVVWNVKDQDPFVRLTLTSELRWEIHSYLVSVLCVDHSKPRESSQMLDIFKEAISNICLNFIGQLLRRNTVFSFLTERDNVTSVMLCPVTQSNWGNPLHYVTYLRTYLLHLQQPSLFVLPHDSAVAATWVSCDKCIFVLYFCLLHNFQNYI